MSRFQKMKRMLNHPAARKVIYFSSGTRIRNQPLCNTRSWMINTYHQKASWYLFIFIVSGCNYLFFLNPYRLIYLNKQIFHFCFCGRTGYIQQRLLKKKFWCNLFPERVYVCTICKQKPKSLPFTFKLNVTVSFHIPDWLLTGCNSTFYLSTKERKADIGVKACRSHGIKRFHSPYLPYHHGRGGHIYYTNYKTGKFITGSKRGPDNFVKHAQTGIIGKKVIPDIS